MKRIILLESEEANNEDLDKLQSELEHYVGQWCNKYSIDIELLHFDEN